VASRTYKTIGEVVDELSQEYPDLTVSKVRFLEDEGLIAPDRTPGGYRKFTAVDVARLEIVLRLQRDHFLPLAVIGEKLKDLDRGRVPEELKSSTVASQPATLPLEETQPVSVSEAPETLGMSAEFLGQLIEFGLVRPIRTDGGRALTARDVEAAHVCWDLRRYGVEPRHLRMFAGFAEKEANLLSQVLMPQTRHRTPAARQKVVETLEGLTVLTGELKRQLLRRALADEFEDVD
jgi:DNA-binding transcriptional MerR regulator